MRKLMMAGGAVVLLACGPGRAERAFVEGGEFYRDGKYLEAVGLYRTALQSDPRNHSYRYSLGLTLARLGQYGESKALLAEVVRAQPENTEAKRMLAAVTQCEPSGAAGLSASTQALIGGGCTL